MRRETHSQKGRCRLCELASRRQLANVFCEGGLQQCAVLLGAVRRASPVLSSAPCSGVAPQRVLLQFKSCPGIRAGSAALANFS
eukprot:9293116-Pyramimonas_sp.AAC.1